MKSSAPVIPCVLCSAPVNKASENPEQNPQHRQQFGLTCCTLLRDRLGTAGGPAEEHGSAHHEDRRGHAKHLERSSRHRRQSEVGVVVVATVRRSWWHSEPPQPGYVDSS